MNRRCGLVLFSGGIDSTIATLSLAQQGNELTALSINYVGRPNLEILTARRLAKRLPFDDYWEVTIGTEELLTIPKYVSTQREGWIPYRNLMFWAIAAHKAVILDADFVAAGHDDADEANYSDVSKEFFGLLRRILRFNGCHDDTHELKMELPVRDLSIDSIKQLLRNGNEGLLYQTWSCWRDSSRPCGECIACKDRQQFLMKLSER